jgi:hypothetical protein
MELVVRHLIWTTVIMTAIASVLVFLVVWIVHKFFRDSATKTPTAMAFVSVVVAAIFGVALNNLFAIRRDRDSRDWNVRQQHLAQLRPVLKSESDRLAGLANEMHTSGFLHGEHARVRIGESEISTYLEPDVMSFDLANHYPGYAASKNRLASDLLAHDRKIVESAEEAAKEIGIHDISWFTAQDLGITYVAHCIGRGPGFTMQIAPDGRGFLSFSTLWQSTGGGEQASPDLLYAYRHYRALRPSPSLQEACESLRKSAANIEGSASSLSKEALLLAQETTLRGNCEFLGIDH